MSTIMALATTATLYLVCGLSGNVWRAVRRGEIFDSVVSGLAALICLASLFTICIIAWSQMCGPQCTSLPAVVAFAWE